MSHWQKEPGNLRQHIGGDWTSWMHVEDRWDGTDGRRQRLRVFFSDRDVRGLFVVYAGQLAEEKDL